MQQEIELVHNGEGNPSQYQIYDKMRVVDDYISMKEIMQLFGQDINNKCQARTYDIKIRKLMRYGLIEKRITDTDQRLFKAVEPSIITGTTKW